MHRTTFTVAGLMLALLIAAGASAAAQLMTKPQVANLIKNVETGVDDYKDYLEKRGENAKSAAGSGAATGRRAQPVTEGQKAAGRAKADDLEEALDDLDKSTNRLRRKFDVTDTWMETKNIVENMMDDGRKINSAVTRGNYGAEAARLWSVLRKGMNDLARAYGVPPMAI